MIQVIERCFNILELLAGHRAMSLKDMSIQLEINKTTLCNILKTMSALGYVAQTINGDYHIKEESFLQILYPGVKSIMFPRLAHKYAEKLAVDTRESGMVSVLVDNNLQIISKSVIEQNVIVNYDQSKYLNIYGSASGRAILCKLSREQLKEVFVSRGIPGYHWPEVNNFHDLEQEIEKIRTKNVIIKTSSDRQVFSIAVPVIEKTTFAALGLNVPQSRFRNSNKQRILDILGKLGEEMVRELQATQGMHTPHE